MPPIWSAANWIWQFLAAVMSAGSTHLSDDIIDWYSELASDYCMSDCNCNGGRNN